MPLKVTYQGKDEIVEDDVTALVGSDAAAAIRIVRPGISRRHAVLSYDGSAWKIEDAGSRNGTFKDGHRIQVLAVESPTSLFLGHPTDGEQILLTPVGTSADDLQNEVDAFVLPATPPVAESKPPAKAAPAQPAARTTRSPQPESSNADLVALTIALRDQINAVKGLTWSVWAMIAVTAALAVMTLFVGILGS